MKLWIYTNYDCNLRCAYCVAESSPEAPRRALDLKTVKRLVDEALDLGFEQVLFTGGEPFILPGIYEMLAYASQCMPTTVLTNALLLHGSRLERLARLRGGDLWVQVSLDGAAPGQHDPYRGAGTWQKTVDGIRRLQQAGLRVRLATTETPANQAYQADLCRFHLSLGIPEEDHIIRPLARRGFSQEGLLVEKATLLPELTVNREGVYWHPLVTEENFLVRRELFPLAQALQCIQEQLQGQIGTEPQKLREFR
jgi:MoaA/NifB/PqqE/SkfB family radical SAM enzyme